MADENPLQEPLTELEAELIESRVANVTPGAPKYVDVTPRVANVLGKFVANPKFIEAITLDQFSEIKSPEKLVMFLRRDCDPSHNGQFTEWLCKRYERQEYLLEDCARAKEALAGYVQHRVRLAIQDINQYKTIAQLEGALAEALAAPVVESKKAESKRLKNEGIFTVHESENGKVIGLRNYEASQYWANGTRWCTAHTNMFGNYFGKDELFVFLPKSGNKYQLHEQSTQFMDKDDVGVWNALDKYVSGKKNFAPGSLVHNVPVEDVQFILEAIPSTYCSTLLSRLGLERLKNPRLESDNPKEISEALRITKDVSPDLVRKLAGSHREYIALTAIGHPQADIETMRIALLQSESVEAKKAALSTDKVDDALIEEFIKKFSESKALELSDLLVQAAQHKHAGIKAAIAAYMSGTPKVMRAGISNPHAPAKLLMHVIDTQDDPMLVIQAGSHKNLPASHLDRLYEHHIAAVRCAAYSNPGTPETKIREALDKEESPAVLKVFSSHPNTPHDLLSKIYLKSGASLRADIACRTGLPESIISMIEKELNPEVVRSFVSGGSADAIQLQRVFSTHPDITVQAAAINNPNFPVEAAIKVVENSPKRALKSIAIRHPGISLDYLASVVSTHRENSIRLDARKSFVDRGGDESKLAQQKKVRIFI